MTQITEHIFIGNIGHARSLEWLKANNITHIVNCTNELDNYFPDKFIYTKLYLWDLEHQTLQFSLEPSYNFIQLAIRNSGIILIHCHAGISRSSSILIYYLMRSNNLKFNVALAHVKKLYPKANPNISFGNQLIKIPNDEIL